MDWIGQLIKEALAELFRKTTEENEQEKEREENS